MKSKKPFLVSAMLVAVLGVLLYSILAVMNVAAEGGTEGAEFISSEEVEKGEETALPTSIDSPAGGPSILGTLDGSSPTWNRVFGGSLDLNCNSGVSDSTSDGQFYAAFPFRVLDSSPLEAVVNAGGTTINDTTLTLYCDPFDPLNPSTNAVFYDDDTNGLLSAFTVADNITLTPGNVYVLVLSTFTAGDMGDYQIDFSSNVVFSGPSISLDKTVGTDGSTCANTGEISVTYSTTVYYCYEVTNTGTVTMTSHDLIDSELGTLLSSFPFTLTPSATIYLTAAATITQTTVNTATWTATDGITEAVSIDTVTVYVPGAIDVGFDAVSVTVALGYSRTYPMYVENIGGESVFYELFDVETGMTTTLSFGPTTLGDVLGNFASPTPGGTPVGLEDNGDGDLLVTDIGVQRIFTMTVGGVLLSGDFAGTGNVIGVTTDGTLIYHTDPTNVQVHSYMPDGTFVNSFSVAAQTTFPEGITYNPETAYLYVVNGSGGNIVSAYQTDGTHVMDWPVLGSSQDGIAYDPYRCNYWIYDSGTDTVRHYDRDFVEIENFPGTINAGFSGGEGLAVVGNELYVMATGSNSVVVFDIFEGQVTEPCAGQLPDAPWLYQNPMSDTVSVQSTNTVQITYDAAVVTQTGRYYATMFVDHDGSGSIIQVPVTMTVVTPTFGVVAAPDGAASGTPGTTLEYTFWITNTGNAGDTYDVVVSGTWPATASESTVTVNPGETYPVTVSVEIPSSGVDEGDMDTTTVMVSSQNSSAMASVSFTSTVSFAKIYLPFIASE